MAGSSTEVCRVLAILEERGHSLGLHVNINSYAGKANYYGTHVVQNKCCALQENAVSKQLALHMHKAKKQLINMLLTTKC